MSSPRKFTDRLITWTTIVYVYTCLLPCCIQANVCSPSNTAKENANIEIRGPNMGNVTSPNFPKSFPLDLLCRWKMFAPAGHIIQLYVDTVDLDVGYFNCISMPYLKIYDGLKDKGAPELVSIRCRNMPLREALKPSFFLISSGQSMEVYFQSAATLKPVKKTGRGFTANYTFLPLDRRGSCGEGLAGNIYIKGQSARLTSPEYRSFKKLKNMTCLWHITADPGFILEIDMISIKLSNSDCGSEFVKIYDGASVNSAILQTMCKDKPEHYLYSSGNTVLVQMKISSSDQRGEGFQMSYRAVKYKRPQYPCNFVNAKRGSVVKIVNSTGTIMSPWYPISYPNNAYCKWSFYSPSFSSVARFTIKNLQLQDSGDCEADYIRIYGRDDFSLGGRKLIGELCGERHTPKIIPSMGRYLEVTFKSDWAKQGSGFEAVIDSIEDDSFRGCKVQGQDNHLALNSSSGSLFSPRYPKPLPPNMMCTWVISVDKGSYIRLQFRKMKLADTCSQGSSLQIRDGASEKSKNLGIFCSFRLPSPIFSSGRHLWVRFISKSKVNQFFENGFHATYRATKTIPLKSSCRDKSLKEIETPSGEIASYEYPLSYETDVVCSWRLIPSKWGMRIKLTFDSFNIQKTPGCTGDFVEVFDGWDDEDKSLGKFCGDKKPDPVYSSGTMMHIRFQSDNQTAGSYQGFKASFETVLNKTSIILIAVGSVSGVILIIGIAVYVYCKLRTTERGTQLEMENLK